MTKSIYAWMLCGCIFCACSQAFVRNQEARDDAREYQRALAAQSQILHSIQAKLETDPVHTDDPDDDAADDPAIWYNAAQPDQSRIFGSNKTTGIHAYDLSGKERQYIPCGQINNIDVRREVRGTIAGDWLGGSNRSDSSLVLFRIAPDGQIGEQPDHRLDLGDFEPYGFCFYVDANGQLFAFVNNKLGTTLQLELTLDETGVLTSREVRRLQLPTQVEGMVADDETHELYIGEEQGGIYLFSARSDGSTSGKRLSDSTDKNKQLRYDLEGLALLPPRYLLASSQGNFSYALFDRTNNTYLTSFTIGDGPVDGVEETDGLEILALPLGADFPNGLLVVQDGFNYENGTIVSQNFKLVDLGLLLPLIEK